MPQIACKVPRMYVMLTDMITDYRIYVLGERVLSFNEVQHFVHN